MEVSKKKENILSVDATAAFDRMVKDRLYAKMAKKNLPGPVVDWFRAFLTDRKARVRVDHATSKYHTFHEGCPQGTILGPLCWLIFIDDLRDLLAEAGGELFMYADDVCQHIVQQRRRQADRRGPFQKKDVWKKTWLFRKNLHPYFF